MEVTVDRIPKYYDEKTKEWKDLSSFQKYNHETEQWESWKLVLKEENKEDV